MLSYLLHPFPPFLSIKCPWTHTSLWVQQRITATLYSTHPCQVSLFPPRSPCTDSSESVSPYYIMTWAVTVSVFVIILQIHVALQLFLLAVLGRLQLLHISWLESTISSLVAIQLMSPVLLISSCRRLQSFVRYTTHTLLTSQWNLTLCAPKTLRLNFLFNSFHPRL